MPKQITKNRDRSEASKMNSKKNIQTIDTVASSEKYKLNSASLKKE